MIPLFITLIFYLQINVNRSFAITCGSQTFTKQTDLDAFAATGCDSILGFLTVASSDISSLDSLHRIKYVSGRVAISGTALLNLYGLDSLRSIGNQLVIDNNNFLENLSGLGSLHTIGDNFLVELNSNLLNFSGLDSLQTINGYFRIDENLALTSTEGMPFLCIIQGNLEIQNNSSLEFLSFPGLSKIRGDVIVMLNSALSDCCALVLMQKHNVFDENISILMNALGCKSLPEIYMYCRTVDIDKDGIASSQDNCPNKYNPDQEDIDSDGIGNVCDNCPQIANPGQADTNNNFIGDICEIAESGKLGINTSLPQVGLQIDTSDVFINHKQRSIIMKNFLGECYRIYVDQWGELQTVQIDCP
jgi:hypothetical protein